MMKQIFLLLSLVLSSVAFAQDTTDSPTSEPKKSILKDRIYVGGGIGAAVGTYQTFGEISPHVGYFLSEDLSVGLGTTFQYYQNRVFRYSTFIYGGRAFARYQLFPFLFVHGEFEHLITKYKDETVPEPYTIPVSGLLAGVGYSSEMGAKSSYYIMILYNFLETQYTPYTNPVIRAGVNIGL